MSLPAVTSTYTGSPASGPTSVSARIVAFIGEGQLSFTTTEQEARFSLAAPSVTLTVEGGGSGDTAYSYVVTTITASGESAASAVAATAVGNTSLTGTYYNKLTWAAVSGATGYNVYRVVASGTPSTLGFVATVAQAASPSYNDVGGAASGALPGSSGVSAAPTVSGSAVGAGGATTWLYVVTSVTAAGESQASAVVTVGSQDATLNGSNYSHLTWASVAGAVSYNVYRTLSGGTPATIGFLASVPSSGSPSYNDVGGAATGAFGYSSDVTLKVPTSVARVGNYQTTTDYAIFTDYILSANGVAWLAGRGPVGGAAYYATYSYAKVSGDFAPQWFTDPNAAAANYGPLSSTITPGKLDPASQLSMAANIAGAIGASQYIMVQINPASPGAPTLADFTGAYTALQNPLQVQGPGNLLLRVKPYYIVPLTGNLSDSDATGAITAALAHCILMADPSFRSERRAYCGMKSDATFNTLIALLEAVGAVNSNHLTVAANFDPSITFTANGVSNTVTLDGSFVAVAEAAYRSTQEVSEPMIGALISVFNGFGTNFTLPQGDIIDDNGGTVIENDNGVIRVLNDVTVNTSSDIEKSIPTVETRDDLIIGIRQQLKNTVLGQRGSLTTDSDIEKEVDEYLELRQTAGDILGASKSSATLNAGSTTKYTVTFSYIPAGEVLSIDVVFSVDLSKQG